MSYHRPFRDRSANFVPYITYAVAALSIALSIAFWAGGDKDGTFGQVSLERIWSGELGGLITTTLLHADPRSGGTSIFHLLFNILWLIRLGPMVEKTLGRLEYGVFLAASAIVASGVEIAFTSHDSVGLSGVVYAVWGLCWAARRSVTSFQLVTTRDTTQYMIGWLVLCTVLTMTGTWAVANGAHAGGLIFGVAIGWLFVDPNTSKRYRVLGGIALASLIATTILAVTYLPWSARWRAWKHTGPHGTSVSAPVPTSDSASPTQQPVSGGK